MEDSLAFYIMPLIFFSVFTYQIQLVMRMTLKVVTADPLFLAERYCVVVDDQEEPSVVKEMLSLL